MAGTVADLLSASPQPSAPAAPSGPSVAPLPPGFVLEDSASSPEAPPPAGFVLETPSPSGIGANLKAGAVEGVTGAIGSVVDAMNPVNAVRGFAQDLGQAASIGGKLLSGHNLTKAESDQIAKEDAAYQDSLNPTPHKLNQAVGAVTGYNPEATTANTFAERLARGAAAGVTSGAMLPLGEGSVAAAMMRGAATGAGAGVGSAAASEVAPGDLKPAAGFVGGILGGGAVGGAEMAGRGIASAAGRAAAPYAAGVSQGAAERAAGAQIVNAATDPAAVRASLEQPGEIVPGSQPTTFQQTGDPGLGSLEREAMTRDQPAFQQRAGEQNAARVKALGDIQQGADPNDVAKTLRDHFDQLDADHEATVQAAAKAAQDKAAQFGGNLPADQYGQIIRDAMATGERGAAAHVSSFYDAIDPNGDLTGNLTATRQGAQKIIDSVGPTAMPMTGPEADVFAKAAGLPDLAPAKQLIDLRQYLNAVARDPAIAGTPTSARLTQLRNVIDDNLANTISQQITNEAPRVLKGQLANEQSLAGRLQAWIDAYHGNSQSDAGALSAGRNTGTSDRSIAGGQPQAVPGASGTKGGRDGGFGGVARDKGVPSQDDIARAQADLARWREPNPNSLFGAIKKLGGLRTRDAAGARIAGPDVEAALTDIRQPGLINNKSGFSPERVAQGLADAGWFGPNPGDPSAAFEAALNREAHGSKVFHPDDQANAAESARLEKEMQEAGVRSRGGNPFNEATKLAAYRAAGRELRAIAEQSGILGADRMSSDDLLGDLQEREAIQAEGAGGHVEPNEHELEFDRLSRSSLAPTFDEAARERLIAANQAAREKAQTWGPASIKNILAKDANGNFRTSDGAVGAKYFHPGASGFQHMQEALTASPQSLPALVDYAATTLRRAAMNEDGTLDPVKYDRWKNAYGDALRALPEDAKARFADAGSASQTLADARSARAAAQKQAESGALARVSKLSEPEDVTRVIGSILKSPTAGADMKALALATKGNPEARAGLRQAVVDHIASRLIGNTEVGTSGLTAIKGDAYQTFMKNARPALNLIFTPEEVRSMQAVAEDIQRSNRTVNSKPAGTPGTAHDVMAGLKRAAGHGSKSMLDIIGGVIGHHLGGEAGLAAGIGAAELVKGLQSKGISRIDNLVSQAMLNPELARELLKKAPVRMAATSFRPITIALLRSSTTTRPTTSQR